jgi:hypothetical protein
MPGIEQNNLPETQADFSGNIFQQLFGGGGAQAQAPQAQPAQAPVAIVPRALQQAPAQPSSAPLPPVLAGVLSRLFGGGGGGHKRLRLSRPRSRRSPTLRYRQ